jgi:hypothetical protein
MRPRSPVLLVLVALSSPLLAATSDQRAADLYARGVALIQKGNYREGARWVREAVDRGAVEPNEAQGSESRFLVRRYDPHYWLGVAHMELGFDALALQDFQRSRAANVISRWAPELADLERRVGILRQRHPKARGAELVSSEIVSPEPDEAR